MSKLKFVFPIIVMFIVIFLFRATNLTFVKFYPVAVNFVFFCMFFFSLFSRETVIQRMARAFEPDIKSKSLEYTRNLTYVWAVVTFCNFLVSLWTVFADEKIWAFYNGCLSYLLIGAVFAAEYSVRVRFKKKYDC